MTSISLVRDLLTSLSLSLPVHHHQLKDERWGKRWGKSWEKSWESKSTKVNRAKRPETVVSFNRWSSEAEEFQPLLFWLILICIHNFKVQSCVLNLLCCGNWQAVDKFNVSAQFFSAASASIWFDFLFFSHLFLHFIVVWLIVGTKEALFL